MHSEFLVQHSLTLRSETARAAACYLAERLGDCSIDAFTVWTFSGDLMLRGRSGGFRFIVDPVACMVETHSRIVFSILSWSIPTMSEVPTECSFCRDHRFTVLEKRFDNETTMLPDQPMASSECGKTAANQRDHSHHYLLHSPSSDASNIWFTRT